MKTLPITLCLWMATTQIVCAQGNLKLQPLPAKYTNFGAGTILSIGRDKVFSCEFDEHEQGLIKLNGKFLRLSKMKTSKLPNPKGAWEVNDEIHETWSGGSIVIDLEFKITEQAECVSYLKGKMTILRIKNSSTFEFSGITGCELNM